MNVGSKGRWWKPSWLFQLAPSHIKTWKVEARDPLPPKDSCSQWIKCNTFSDPREFIPLLQAEGQPYFHCPSCDCWKWWGWSRLWCEAGRRRDGTFGWWRGWSIRQSRINRSTYGVNCLLCQGSWTTPAEEQKLFQVWESKPPSEWLP